MGLCGGTNMRLAMLRHDPGLAWLPTAAAATPAQGNGVADRRLDALADAFVAARLERDPDLGYYYALPLGKRLESRLFPRSPADLRQFDAAVDRASRALPRIDRGDLDHPHRVLHALLSEELAAFIGLRLCHQQWWDAGHIGGWLGDTIDLARIERAGNPAHPCRVAAAMVVSPPRGRRPIANLTQGLAHGYSAPRAVVERTIAHWMRLPRHRSRNRLSSRPPCAIRTRPSRRNCGR